MVRGGHHKLIVRGGHRRLFQFAPICQKLQQFHRFLYKGLWQYIFAANGKKYFTKAIYKTSCNRVFAISLPFSCPIIFTVQSRRLTECIVLQHPQYPRTQKMLLYILHSAYLPIYLVVQYTSVVLHTHGESINDIVKPTQTR